MTDGIKIDFQNNINEVLSQFKHFDQEQRDKALAKGLLDVGYIGRLDVKEKTERALHKPTRFTVNSFLVQTGKGYTPAMKSNWKNVVNNNFNVYIRIKDNFETSGSSTAPVKYLFNLLEGGSRSAKSGELQMRTTHLGPNQFMIPASAFRDAHGNIRRGIMQQVLADTRTQRSSGYDSIGTKTRLERRTTRAQVRRNAGVLEYVYMTPKGGKRKPGVYERYRGIGEQQTIRPVLITTSKAPTYKKNTFPFFKIINNFIDRRGEKILMKSFLKLDK